MGLVISTAAFKQEYLVSSPGWTEGLYACCFNVLPVHVGFLCVRLIPPTVQKHAYLGQLETRNCLQV